MSHDPIRPIRRFAVATVALVLALPVALSSSAAAADDVAPADGVSMLILRENGVGSSSRAQKFIDQLMVSFARVNDWSAASGKYHSRRKPAEAYIAEAKPSYGFFSLGAYLALRGKYGLEPLGKASVSGGGGEQYYVVSKTATTLDECKGQSLATNHGSDAGFVNKVVFAGAVSLTDFEVVETRRPLQTLKKVTRDEAVCALLDDAQMAELSNTDGGAAVKPIWFSGTFPSVVVVSFPVAADATNFKSSLSKVCEGEGKTACDQAGIRDLQQAGSEDLAALHKAYDG